MNRLLQRGRSGVLAVFVAWLVTTSAGCQAWRAPKLDLNTLRDPRAVEIDSRLSGPPSGQDASSQ